MKVLATMLLMLGLCFGLNAADGGTIKGSVKYEGEIPAPKILPIPADKQGDCKCKEIDTEELVVDKASKGIKWAIVRVIDAKPAGDVPTPAKVPQLDQKGCRFEPRVVIVPPGTDLEVLNPDGVAHNVRTTGLDLNNPGMNKMMAPSDPKMVIKGSKFLAEAEVVQFNCDIHPWMKSFVVVHDPRFAAITNADGSYEIKNVPPGKYTLKVWQERCGEKPLSTEKPLVVEVKAGETVDAGVVNFTAK